MNHPKTLRGYAKMMCQKDIQWAREIAKKGLKSSGDIEWWEQACEVLSVVFLANEAGIEIPDSESSHLMRSREKAGAK